MRLVFLLLALAVHVNAFAQVRVVVIPLGGDDVKPLQNIITVAMAHGEFTSPIDAVNSIPTQGPLAPSRTNPYLVVVAPGLYELTQPLFIPSHVSLAGSGRKTTILQFELEDIPMGFSIAVGTSLNTSISDMAIQNVVLSGPPQGTSGIAISNDTDEVLLERLDVLTAGHVSNIGIRNRAGQLDMQDLKVIAKGGSSAVAVKYIDGAEGRVMNLVASGEEATAENIGMMISDSSPSITNAEINLENSFGAAIGMKIIDSRTSITTSFVSAFSDVFSSEGINIEGSQLNSAPRISNSTLQGSSGAVNLNEEAVNASITGSRILGRVVGDALGIQCRDNYDFILKAVSC